MAKDMIADAAENIGADAAEEQEKKTAEDNPYLVVFTKPYVFEREEYDSIDLSGLEKLTIRDAINAQKELFLQREVAASILCETTTAFAVQLAVKASGKPIEFFKTMPRTEGRMVRQAVQRYVKANSSRGDGTLELEKTYYFEGAEYTEVDLSGIADINTMQEIAAENAMAREGFVITENSFNYLYACVIAGMASGLPTGFFTGLPLRELMNLKETVNNAGFFE